MNKSLKIVLATLTISAALGMSACGSSDGGTPPVSYNGNTSAAKVDASNAQAIGSASGESVNQAGGTSNAPVFAQVSATPTENLEALSRTIIEHIRNRPLANTPSSFSFPGSCGGSITGPDTQEPPSGPFSITIKFNNYCDEAYGSTLILNGRATYSTPDVNDPNVFTIQYINFTINDNGNISTLNLTMSCTSGSCSFVSDFKASDGSVHRTADIVIDGDAINGYDGTMTFYHSDYGYVSITVSNITYGACSGPPNGGSITFTGTGDSTGTITFASDCTYSGTYDDGEGDTGTF